MESTALARRFSSRLVVSPPTSVGGVDALARRFSSQLVVSPPTSVGGVDALARRFSSQLVVSPPTSVGGVDALARRFSSQLVVSPPTSVGGVDALARRFSSQLVVSPPTSVGGVACKTQVRRGASLGWDKPSGGGNVGGRRPAYCGLNSAINLPCSSQTRNTPSCPPARNRLPSWETETVYT